MFGRRSARLRAYRGGDLASRDRRARRLGARRVPARAPGWGRPQAHAPTQRLGLGAPRIRSHRPAEAAPGIRPAQEAPGSGDFSERCPGLAPVLPTRGRLLGYDRRPRASPRLPLRLGGAHARGRVLDRPCRASTLGLL